jgi:hypothetical protein
MDALQLEPLLLLDAASSSIAEEDFKYIVEALKCLDHPLETLNLVPQEGTIRAAVDKLVHTHKFENFMDGLLVLNLLFEVCLSHGRKQHGLSAPETTTTANDKASGSTELGPLVFALAYLAELVLRSVASGGLYNYVCLTSARSSFDGSLTLVLLAIVALV